MMCQLTVSSFGASEYGGSVPNYMDPSWVALVSNGSAIGCSSSYRENMSQLRTMIYPSPARQSSLRSDAPSSQRRTGDLWFLRRPASAMTDLLNIRGCIQGCDIGLEHAQLGVGIVVASQFTLSSRWRRLEESRHSSATFPLREK